MQRLYAALHGTLGFYLRDALQEDSAEAMACLSVPQALGLWWVLPRFFVFACRFPLVFRVSNFELDVIRSSS
jgi:hypothetical protein